MRKIRWLIPVIAVLTLAGALLVLKIIKTGGDSLDAFSGATPLALSREVPQGLSLKIDGDVKQEYRLTSRSFRLLAPMRIRTPEVNSSGEIVGTYIYTGIPVLYILEGVVPKKEANAAFDRPLDMMVTFSSTGGQSSSFSYGELTMSDDAMPVTLAYHREPLLPTKNPESYTGNLYRDNIAGLRLICPREPDTKRWLDDVVRMTLTVPGTPDHLLPRQKKGSECTSTALTCVEDEREWPASIEDVPLISVSRWFRIGHGRGVKASRPSSASGYSLPDFLTRNFPPCTPDDFFLFVGCDGYRALFSGREIFCTGAGSRLLLLTTLDGQAPKKGFTVGAVSDFFVDRCVWGLSHIVRLRSL